MPNRKTTQKQNTGIEVPINLVKKTAVASSLLLTPFILNGCSTLSDSADAVGSGVVYIAEGVQKTVADVQVKKIDESNFELQTSFNEPVQSLDSWAMRIEARKLCPDGYIYENRNAIRAGAFGESDAACLAAGNCTYKLNWRIKCQDVPEEPFSFFGKT